MTSLSVHRIVHGKPTAWKRLGGFSRRTGCPVWRLVLCEENEGAGHETCCDSNDANIHDSPSCWPRLGRNLRAALGKTFPRKCRDVSTPSADTPVLTRAPASRTALRAPAVKSAFIRVYRCSSAAKNCSREPEDDNQPILLPEMRSRLRHPQQRVAAADTIL